MVGTDAMAGMDCKDCGESQIEELDGRQVGARELSGAPAMVRTFDLI
jgi:uncharacterized ferredoxin-like protein